MSTNAVETELKNLAAYKPNMKQLRDSTEKPFADDFGSGESAEETDLCAGLHPSGGGPRAARAAADAGAADPGGGDHRPLRYHRLDSIECEQAEARSGPSQRHAGENSNRARATTDALGEGEPGPRAIEPVVVAKADGAVACRHCPG